VERAGQRAGDRRDGGRGAADGPSARTAAGYAGAACLVAATTGIAWGGRAALGLPDVELLFVLPVLLSAIFLGRGPAVAAAALGVAAYDFFFVPPSFTFDVHDVRYLLTFAMMLGIGVAVSSLAARLRERTHEAEVREGTARAEAALAAALAEADGEAEVAAAAARFCAGAFGGSAAVLRPGGPGPAVLAAAGDPPPERVRAWAETAVATGRAAGGPDGVLCLPLRAGVEPVAVLALHPWAGDRGRALESLAEAAARHVGAALERARLSAEARRAETRATSERLRSDLLSSVSHDLRTPLAVITGAATALRDAPGTAEPERRELVESICEEADRMERLVRDLLHMTRLQGGEVSLRRDWLPLEEVVGPALARVEPRLGARPVTVDVGSAPAALGDAVLLEQALVNLLENAAKYTPPGSPVEVRAAADARGVALEVADRGPGVPPGEEERIFERFQRGSHPGVAGAGLGLAIARAVARAHGGELTASARPGGGAVFRLSLPAAPRPATAGGAA
jgi:two-component system sensor histidine kinase KdpD